MSQERRKGLFLSGLVHALVILATIVGLPSLLAPPPPTEPHIITVELLPIGPLSNVKPSESQSKPEPKAEEKKQAKPSPPVKTAEAVPPPPSEMGTKPKEKEKEKEKDKKDDKKKDEKKKPKEDDLAAVLKAVRETAQKEKEKQAKEKEADKPDTPAAKSEHYDPAMALSISETDAIRSQISKCWNVPAGAKDAHDLVVVLKIQLNQDGSLISVELASESKSRYNSDSFFRAAADSAIRAVRQCTPLQGLAPEKFATWRDMTLTFNPRDMLF